MPRWHQSSHATTRLFVATVSCPPPKCSPGHVDALSANSTCIPVRAANREKRTLAIAQVVEQEKPKRGRVKRPVLLAGDMNADKWGKDFAEEKLFGILEDAGFANPLGDLPPKARGTHPSAKWGDSALDYVFCRGLKTAEAPRIIPNDGLSDHYALFVLLKQ